VTSLAIPPGFSDRLRVLAEVIVRVGLNLQPDQRLLIAEPYELQGVARGAEELVGAIRAAAQAAGAGEVMVIWGEASRLRLYAEQKDWRNFAFEVGANTRLMDQAVRRGDALLFLQSGQLHLMDGIPHGNVNELRHIAWEYFGPIAQQLTTGATNWTVAPAPIAMWAHDAYADLPRDTRLGALWNDVFRMMRIPRWSAPSGPAHENPPGGRIPTVDAVSAWRTHLHVLQTWRAELNARRLRTLRYRGPGTDFTIALPSEHIWCTACLTTKSGLPFVANLPTEEVFTAPHRDSADGGVRVSRPINYGGSVIDGIELEFKRGRVVSASARTGGELLKRMLETDEGSVRLGEVALVSPQFSPAAFPRLFYHPLLDENAANHIALGEAYGFTSRNPRSPALNHSLIHVDLPLAAEVELPGAEPS
jgi:aminopeptidase